MEDMVLEMNTDLVDYIITLTFSFLFFIVGWAMPRGNAQNDPGWMPDGPRTGPGPVSYTHLTLPTICSV